MVLVDQEGKIIMENAGTQFDADIADIFYQVRDEFEKVASEMQPPAV
jgi:response regulator RpfG family c-di-GMP phosphodiesterase